MATADYTTVMEQIRRLPPEEQRRLTEELRTTSEQPTVLFDLLRLRRSIEDQQRLIDQVRRKLLAHQEQLAAQGVEAEVRDTGHELITVVDALYAYFLQMTASLQDLSTALLVEQAGSKGAAETAIDPPKRRSILELRGLGKDLWRRVDSTAYLNEERAAWDG